MASGDASPARGEANVSQPFHLTPFGLQVTDIIRHFLAALYLSPGMSRVIKSFRESPFRFTY